MNLQNKRITIIGAQKSGMAAAELASQRGAQVKLSDAGQSANTELIQWAKANNIVLETGGHTHAFFEGSDYIVLSPGVSIQSGIVQYLKAQSICVLGEIEFAFQMAQAPVIAITGSNGKTTVSTLVHHLLSASSKRSVLCGNIGTPFSKVVAEETPDYFVVEVSSFQMESLLSVSEQRTNGIKGFRPNVGLLLNINQNHLDRHADMKEYAQAKLKMFMNQTTDDFSIFDQSLPEQWPQLNSLKSQKYTFGDSAASGNPNKQALDQVGKIFQIESSLVDKVYSGFSGVEHRLEKCGMINNVHFINDSKSTTIESGRWALANVETPIILLCGGRDKNLDFTVLEGLVSQKIKTLIAYGEAKTKIIKAFATHTDKHTASNLSEAFTVALKVAEEGDHVLLSPMCASFDEFNNFEERGAYFKKLVTEHCQSNRGAAHA